MIRLKKLRIGAITIIFVVLVLSIICFRLISNMFVVKDLRYNIATNSYINSEKYVGKGYAFRNVEYVGGVVVDINRPYSFSNKEEKFEGKRWMPFYRDKNTNEVLRGFEREDFISAGGCYVGLDHLDIPKERMTKEGFCKYVLDWTGSVLYMQKNNYKGQYLEKYNRISKKYADGVYECNESIYPYDVPIDLLAESMWCIETKRDKNHSLLFDNIDDIRNIGALDSGNYVNYGSLSENEWVLSILRNCFGYISDDFYDFIDKNKINFPAIEIDNVKVGDIGIFNNDEDNKAGICIGFDNQRNPIFTICTSKQIINNLVEMNNYDRQLVDILKIPNSIFGYNILHIENLNGKNRVFSKYYSTNLPFTDNEINNSKNIKLIINDIKKYNEQILYKINIGNKIWEGDDLSKRLINERIRRISDRENKANKIRYDNNIDIEQYKDKDISNLYYIFENNTYEYGQYLQSLHVESAGKMGQNINKTSNNTDIGNYRRKTDMERVLEKKNEQLNYYFTMSSQELDNIYNNELNQKHFQEFIINNKEVLKESDDMAIKEYMISKFGDTGDYIFIIRYIKEHPDILE